MKTHVVSRRSSTGFTLIELLVVMAILGILMALLFPVIREAKEKARGAKCISNLNQMGDAIHLYQADFIRFHLGITYSGTTSGICRRSRGDTVRPTWGIWWWRGTCQSPRVTITFSTVRP